MSKIIITEVSDHDRINFLPEYFGPYIPQALKMENRIYKYANDCIEKYNGGYWIFKEASNGAGYMVPSYTGIRNVTQAENYYTGGMSADAVGLAITTLVTNQFAFENQTKKLCDLWKNLMDVISSHEEVAQIRRFLD